MTITILGLVRLEMVPVHIGIQFDWLSDYEKFEAPDQPDHADWVARWYAVVNLDVILGLGREPFGKLRSF